MFTKFKKFKLLAENKLSVALRIDKEGEYISNEFAKFCEQKGTIMLPTHPNIIKELRERIRNA
jgi:hypothetical protein